jgi:nucleoside 2-deoxyribosyltransferase
MFREQPQAFIALPHGPAEPELRAVISETLDRHEVLPMFADDASPATSPSIQELLRNADLVIADITGADTNVMVEVGIALGMGKPLLLLSQSRSTDLPIDLRAHQVAVYRRGDMDSVRKFMELSLRDSLRERASLKA